MKKQRIRKAMKTEYKKLKNLFLRQSCQDAWEDYARSIRKVNFPRWDYVILTSSNEEQARSFRSQIADRLEQGVLPGWTKYFVLPDPEGKRVGSGGATKCTPISFRRRRTPWRFPQQKNLGDPFRRGQQKSAAVFCMRKAFFPSTKRTSGWKRFHAV